MSDDETPRPPQLLEVLEDEDEESGPMLCVPLGGRSNPLEGRP